MERPAPDFCAVHAFLKCLATSDVDTTRTHKLCTIIKTYASHWVLRRRFFPAVPLTVLLSSVTLI